jgi:small GTP-binding protein
MSTDQVAEPPEDPNMPLMKVVLLGSSLVGKTTIVTRAITSEFDQEIKPTVGASYASRLVTVGEQQIQLRIWDTAGQERFRTLVPMYFRGAMAALVVFSIIDPASLNEVDFWANAVKQSATPPPAIFIVANKMDLEGERLVSVADAQEVANRYDGELWEVSAKTGAHIEEMIARVAEIGIERNKTKPRNTKREGAEVVAVDASPAKTKTKSKCC